MNQFWELLGYQFNQRALLAAVLIGFLNGYFSGYVVLRKSSLFTGALSHTLLPGIAIGILLFGLSVASTFVGALAAAMIIALASLGISRGTRIDRDSALAILYTASFSGGLLLLEKLPVNIEISHILFGNILGLADADLWMVFAVFGFVLTCLILFQRPLLLTVFEPNIAASLGIPVRFLNYLLVALLVLTMITSLQAVGAILSLGLLVAPAAIMYLFVDSPRLLFWGGGILGAVISVAAILLSNMYDIRTGATIVLLLGTVFLLCFIFSPRYGLIRSLIKTHYSKH